MIFSRTRKACFVLVVLSLSSVGVSPASAADDLLTDVDQQSTASDADEGSMVP